MPAAPSPAAPAVQVRGLTKTYRVPERDAGLGAAVASLFRRRFREVHAVSDLDFDIAPGEIVGFLGPNGAGKTTTIKMLAGLLHPSDGEARVLGFEPKRREKAYLGRMALVMGNRNQLAWDLPVLDSFELNRAIYRIPEQEFRWTRDAFIDLLDLGGLVRKPVRNLSLGERMKVEIAASLLHRPQVLFLDEPTIGLDVTMQQRIRAFVADYNQRLGATVLLTSHYMADVEALCERVIVIHEGRLLFDGRLDALVARFAPHKRVTVSLAPEVGPAVHALAAYGEVTDGEGARATLLAPKTDVPRLTAHLLSDLPVVDLEVQDPPVEAVIEQLFAVGARQSEVETERVAIDEEPRPAPSEAAAS